MFDSLGVDFENVDYDDVKKALDEINGGAGGGGGGARGGSGRGGGVRGVHPSRVSRGEMLPSLGSLTGKQSSRESFIQADIFLFSEQIETFQ